MHEHSTPLTEFYAAVVNEQDLMTTQCCPICEEVGFGFEKIKDIEEDSGSLRDLIVGEILTCNNCGCVVISVAYPIMQLTEPVYLDWSIFKAVNPEKGNQQDGATFTVVTSGAVD